VGAKPLAFAFVAGLIARPPGLQAKIARYRRSLRAVFDPDVLPRLG